MNKYIVKVGSLVTVFRGRRFKISASSEDEAIKKAEDRFCDIAKKSNWDVGGGINIDSLQKLR